MSFELSAEHEQFRRTVRDFAEKEIAPHAAQWDRDHHFPVDVVQKMGELGLMGLTAPEEYGGAGLAGEDGGFTSLCLAIEEIGRVDQSMGITLEAAVGLGINPILDLRHRRAEADLAARPGRRRQAGRLRPHRARRRLRRGRDAGPRRCSPTASGSSTAPSSSSPTPAPTSPRCVTVTAKTGERRGRPARDLRDHRAGRHPRLHRREGLRQARLARLRHPPAVVRGLPGPRGQPARRPRSRLRPVPRHPRRRPGRDRGARRRLPPGLPRHVAAVRRRAADVRRTRSGASRASPSRSPTSR